MSISIFVDKLAQPSAEALQAALGNQAGRWEQICAFLMAAYGLPGTWNYGGKNYGWNLSYRKGSRPLLSLYPRQGGLTAQIVLGKGEVQKACALALGKHFARLLRETSPFHDGMWLFVPLEDEQDVQDVLQLVQVKARPQRVRAQTSPDR